MNELNTFFRTLLNGTPVLYQTVAIPIHFQFDTVDTSSYYIVGSLFTTEPEQLGIGFDDKQRITGYYNIETYLPSSDIGLDWAINDIADQLKVIFARGSTVLSCGKIEITNIELITASKNGGQVLSTARVNFSSVL